ncbi:ATP-binding domain-containing protein [Sphaerisporangium sp. NPDC051017]|uniref:HelD family protein n=1 Tax=Sphaerisporangium sp. NPDC051017 TaxID=3154636 RepID=UPI00344314B7
MPFPQGNESATEATRWRIRGRAGLRDADDALVLIDWRAPAARPFYTATPSDPGPLVRRRHLHTRGRTVVHLDDEVFDLGRMSEPDRRTLVGEAALMAALRRGRTGRMGDVVATIQAEQDQVIRSGLPGALVVQGAPCTGKTVAALHRAAYLLYAHRDTLERRGVLVIGPNALFLRYIGQVLPALGETDVVLTTVGELYPGVRATAQDTPEAAIVKGDTRMTEVIRAAVRDRQRVPEGDLVVGVPVKTSVRGGVEVVVERMTLHVDHATCVRARDRARAVRNPHNVARKLFVDSALTALALDEAERLDVIVDEAQELSAMAWRTVMRRIPTRSLTVVGDVAQTGSAAGARSWAEMLDPYVRGRWREARLLVNYRTPAEIMEVAADVLKAVDPAQRPPISVRDGEAPPRAVRAARADLATVLPELVRSELEQVTGLGEGRLAVLTPDARHGEIAALLPGSASALTAEALDSPSAVLTVTQSKGLEFDAVIVLAPDEILAQGPKGGQDLYVAITRATRRLTVVHENALPPMLARLRG